MLVSGDHTGGDGIYGAEGEENLLSHFLMKAKCVPCVWSVYCIIISVLSHHLFVVRNLFHLLVPVQLR